MNHQGEYDFFGAVDEADEESVGFPSIMWDEAPSSSSSSWSRSSSITANSSCSSSGDYPLNALSNALKILDEADAESLASNKRIKISSSGSSTSSHGMVRSKALKSSLASLASSAISCSQESNESANVNNNTAFMLETCFGMVTARSVTPVSVASGALKSSPFETSELLTVQM